MSAQATPEQLEKIANRAQTLGTLFYDRVAASANREAFRFPDADENWHSLTWAETGEHVTKIAAGLVALGIQPEERVAIACNTRYEWTFADLAINAAGAATTTVYPTTSADDEAYILADSGSRIVFAEDDEQIKKLHEKRAELPEVFKVVTIDGTADGDWVIGLADLEALGTELLAKEPNVVADRVAATKPGDLATLIYTSGTTGRPKGVRLTHTGWTYEGAAIASSDLLGPDDLEFRWLPMSHSFGKVLQTLQITIGYATAIDGRVPKIVDNLAVVKPTFMGAAPRIFEKAYGRIIGMVEEEGGAKLKIFKWAEKVGLEYSRAVRSGSKISPVLKAQHAVADKLVFHKVRDRFGGRVRFFISGAAALSQDVAEWFHSAGVLILEGYGMTETSAGATVNRPDAFKLGSVGLPFPGSEVKIAEDGEVLIKGPHIMEGYHNLESENPITADGFMQTGDIGEIDAEGFLRITDRKKDLFKTSGGKYIAPSHIEGLFKGISPLASQLVILGKEKNFVSALIALDADAIAAWAESNGKKGTYAELVKSSEIAEIIDGQIAELNSKLNKWETVKKWVILDKDLSVESGELTPSLKLKRKVVEEKYADTIADFYS